MSTRIRWSGRDSPPSTLRRAVGEGARGLKIFKELGLRHRDDAGRLVLPHDPRIGDVFAACADLKVPCLYHVADPRAFFRPLDGFNERWEELRARPEWHFFGPEFPSYEQLMESQERLIEAHPGTLFQAAHVASASEDLGYVRRLLDRYPNLNVDISARIAELGRQPYTARRFFVEYADRILYATDQTPVASVQRVHMRLLETRDEYFPYHPGDEQGQGRWRIYGLGLPDDVLEKVYFRNAERLYGRP
ncbi:MAG TPA: amidohydrolase family protein [Phycisphaerae bacterium]|nr:amidohydrolase family protein [Phycisphaerae bacterium]